jgi:hypothetical protein
VKATAVVPPVTVPGLFFGKPVPVTVTDVPAGPEEGLRLTAAVAACTAGAVPVKVHATRARTYAMKRSFLIGLPRLKAPFPN